MSDLYEICPTCHGTGELDPSTRICFDPPSAREMLKRLPNGNFECFGCVSRRVVETGVTAGQLEGLKSENARLRLALAKIQKQEASP